MSDPVNRVCFPCQDDVLVTTMGNPLRGDDGIGTAILEELAGSELLPPEVTLLDSGLAGLGMVLMMRGYRRVVIVDAADMGLAPGEWMQFTPDDIVLQPDNPSQSDALHNMGLAEVLGLGRALGILPPQIVIYGVQPQELGWMPGLSEPVKQVIPVICSAILEELQDMCQ